MTNMSSQKKIVKIKQLKNELSKEFNFMKNVFSMLSIPIQMKGENEDMIYEIVTDSIQNDQEEKDVTKRARSIAELGEKLEKLKSEKKFNLKTKLVKKSLTSKINKKIKKKERLNKNKVKLAVNGAKIEKGQNIEKANVNVAKPVFNNDGKLVFSKFDFAKSNHRENKNQKAEKDPKKILEYLKQQEQKIRDLQESEEVDKAKEIKEKIAWKNIMQKAEGQKVKDDPTLLKKSIKKMEQKKKQSKKQWENRVQSVEQKKEERQKKRKENINKKKKEKKSKIIKTAVKRGRVVI